MLMRVDEGRTYYVVVEGPICYYVKRNEGFAAYDEGNVFVGRNSKDDQAPKEYFSLGVTGEIQKLKDKDLDSYLEKYNLKNAYDGEK